MAKKEQGFILVTVMSMMLVLAFIACIASEQAILAHRFSYNFEHKLQALQFASATVKTIFKEPYQQKFNCFEKNILTDAELTDKTDGWWLSHKNCYKNYDNYRVYYFMEEYASEPCAIILNQASEGTKYFRITLRTLEENNQSLSLIQIIYAVPWKPRKECAAKKWKVQPGQQSWRQLL